MRAKPYSGKQKRQQLKEKRARRLTTADVQVASTSSAGNACPVPLAPTPATQKKSLLSQWDPLGGSISLEQKASQNPDYSTNILPSPPCLAHVNVNAFYSESSIELPRRPPWKSSMSITELEESETKAFQHWLNYVYSVCPKDQLGYFEHNLEVWRQFWRVCEMSDVVVVVLDARFPILHYPKSLHSYIKSLEKPFVVALMKCDLLHDSLIDAWCGQIQTYFREELNILRLSIFAAADGTWSRKRYRGATGITSLLTELSLRSHGRFLEEWQQITTASRGSDLLQHLETPPDGPLVHEGSLFTVGMIGHPNVGKSSLINCIMGRKVVSASRTPGHTKHFQTIHLSEHIRLCDCPGLIFPLAIERPMQVLNGLYNVAQVRDPFGSLQLAGNMVDLPRRLGLERPSPYTIMGVCEGFAIKSGFFTSRAGRPDVNRAANLILRMIFDGRIIVAWLPGDYAGPVEHPENSDSSIRMPSLVETDLEDGASSGSMTSTEDDQHSNPYNLLLETY